MIQGHIAGVRTPFQRVGLSSFRSVCHPVSPVSQRVGLAGPVPVQSFSDRYDLTFVFQQRPHINAAMDKEPTGDTVDELRQRLNNMKRIMAERQRTGNLDEGRRSQGVGVIDGSFLSVVFGVALLVIITVSLYAFYNLYNALLKKFQSHHEEL